MYGFFSVLQSYTALLCIKRWYMINDFFNLIFPKICYACDQVLLRNEKNLCLKCILTLPQTNYHNDNNNPVSKIFWGRAKVEMATSFYKFSKKSRVQRLLHNLKYRGAKEVGIVVGEQMGRALKDSKHYQGIDFIVPVPLHKNKLKKRGYNQSECFANGLSKVMKIPINTNALIRVANSQTQTKKGRYKRWENVGEIFRVQNNQLEGKRILLVDDVVTTGATIEACIQALSPQHCEVLVATIACG